MRTTLWAVVLLVGVVGGTEVVQAQEEVHGKPVDVYISGFGGYSFPFKTDVTVSGAFGSGVISDVDFEDSPSFGGKIGMWFTGQRKALGIDIGMEVDVTHFDPDSDLSATYYGLNALARVPMGITPDLPNGRWFPYIGLGGGAQHLVSDEFGGMKPTHTAPAFQGLGGVKVFLFKHLAVFVEGKFTHASHRLDFNLPGFGTIRNDFTLNSVHGVGGLSLHF